MAISPLDPRFPGRATHWRLRTRVLEFRERPLLMGIVNVTPDSFSDGGKFLDPDVAVAHAVQLVDDGADLLDIGGESTRPGAVEVSEAEELRRVLPVIEQLAPRVQVPISIDTRKAAVAKAAIQAGCEIVNDVSGLEGDPETVGVVAAAGTGVCVMHMRGTPETMQLDPQYEDVVREVHDYLRSRRDALEAAGIPRERICLDPGIGFGKLPEHNLELLKNCHKFHDLGCPVLVGHSRKSVLGHLLGNEKADRTQATIDMAVSLAGQGVQILRVHDVALVRRAIIFACGNR
jgi:dihydropteroate synthase